MQNLTNTLLTVLIAAALGCGGKSKPAEPANTNAATTAAAGAKCAANQVFVASMKSCQQRCSTEADCSPGNQCLEIEGQDENRREQAQDGSFTGPVMEPDKFCGGD